MHLSGVITGAFNTVGAQVLSLLVALVCIPALLALLGPERFGALSLCITALAAMNLANLGLGPVASREIAAALARDDQKAARCVLAATSTLLMILALVICIGARVLARPISEVLGESGATATFLEGLLETLCYVLPLALIALHIRSALEGVGAFGVSASIRVASNASYFVSPLIAQVALGDPDWGIAAIGPLLAALSLWGGYRLRAALGGFQTRVSALELGSTAKKAAGYSAFSVSQLFLLYSDRYVVASFVGLGAAGAYSAAADIATRVNLLYGTFTQPLLPAFSSWVSSNRMDALGGALILFSAAVQRALFLAAFAGLLCGPFFFDAWLGSTSGSIAAAAFPWLLFAFIIAGLSSVPQRLLLAIRADLKLAVVYGVLAGVFVPLSIVSAHAFALQGVCAVVVLRGLAESLAIGTLGIRAAPRDVRADLKAILFVAASTLTLVLIVSEALGRSSQSWTLLPLVGLLTLAGCVWSRKLESRAVPDWRAMFWALRSREWK